MDPAYAKAEADCAFYENPEHLRLAGPGRRRKDDQLTEIVSVRLSKRMLAAATAAAEVADRELSDWLRQAVSFELMRLGRERRAREERPTGLIPGSGRKGEQKALRSSLQWSLGTQGGNGGWTFACPHMSIGGVAEASCDACGPMSAVA
jgi:hypothetical protein